MRILLWGSLAIIAAIAGSIFMLFVWFVLFERPSPILQAAPAQAKESNQTVRSAFRLCVVFDSSKLLSEKCSVSGWNNTVSISLDMRPAEALKICEGLPALMAQVEPQMGKFSFDPGWQVKIFSPYSGQRPIASCDL